jgi:hypothetical protein
MAMADATAIELTARLVRRDPAGGRAGIRVLLEGNTQYLDSQRTERKLGSRASPVSSRRGFRWRGTAAER